MKEAEDMDVFVTPKIRPSTFYPPKDQEIEEPKDQPVVIPVDPVEAAETEARSEQERIYFSSTCPPGECMKQTPKEEAVGKRYLDHYEKTG